MKDLLDWFQEMGTPSIEEKPETSAEIEIEVKKVDNQEEDSNDKKTMKCLKALTISNLVSFTIQQGINKPDGDMEKLKEKVKGYVEMLKNLIEEL